MDWLFILFVSATMLVMLSVARVVNQFVMHTKTTEALNERQNPAIGIEVAGYLFSVVLITASVLKGGGADDLLKDAASVAAYGIGGILFLALVASRGLRLLHAFDCLAAIREGNVAAAITAAGSCLATGLVIAGSVAGDSTGGNAITSIVFFVAGLISLVIITRLFRFLTAYDDEKEILSGNVAAALSYAGLMIGVGIAIENGINGDFVDYPSSFMSFGKALLVVLAFYPIRQLLVQVILLGGKFSFYGGSLDVEISRDRNLNVGVIEATTYIAAAILVTQLS
jgi:uncharacterized membrane protein YjfL (UPF0719 family)